MGVPIPAHKKLLRGSFDATRDKPRATDPRYAPIKMPAGLTLAQRQLFRQTLDAAPWLTRADVQALVLWVKAVVACDEAERIADVKSLASMATRLAGQLGLTPASRRMLGIDIEPQPQPADAGSDPWAILGKTAA